MFTNEKGFTLIEMLVVILIISFLMLLIIPNLGTKSEKVQNDGCKALKAVVQNQVDMYFLDEKKLPESLDELVSEKYISKSQLECSNKSLVLNNGKVTYEGDSDGETNEETN